MGISEIVAIPSTLLLSFVFLLRGKLSPIVLFPFLHASIVGFIASLTAHPSLNLPLLFRKRSDGTFPWWSVAVFHPYLITLRLYVWLRRRMSGEPVYDQVMPQLYVGGWPRKSTDIPPGEPAIIDCTCELPRSTAVRNLNVPYMCIPTWDTRGIRVTDIENAVGWAAGKRLQNQPIFIHCAFGHGRSVSVMCALLVTLGLAEDWKDAEKIIKKCRPGINMNILQRKSLEDWSKFRTRPSQHVETSNVSFSFLSEKSNADY